MAATVVRVSALRKSYGAVTALDGMELEVAEGEIFGLLGPNGAGKTTTVKLLVTLERPDAGEARVLGLDVAREAEAVRAAIGYVPQELTADRALTARENLELFCDLYHVPRAARAPRVAELLRLVGLEEAADRRLRTFSGGMKKKVDLACGLVHRPRLLFLDEPSLGLDVEVRSSLWEHVLALREAGTTVLLCTNYMDEADRLCDRIAIVDRGRVVALGTPRELRAGLGGDVVSIELAAEEGLEAAEAAVRAAAPVAGSWREGRRLHVTVDRNERSLPVLLEALVRAQVAVESVSYHRPGLEEVFLRHAGKRYAEAQAQGTSGPPPRRRR